MEKVRWMDDHWARLDGGRWTAELVDGSVYLAISIRNVGSGLAVPFGLGRHTGAGDHPGPTRRAGGVPAPNVCTLDAAPSDFGFWEAAIPSADQPDDPDYPWLSRAVASHDAFTIELLYGDHDGGQRTITRFWDDPVVEG